MCNRRSKQATAFGALLSLLSLSALTAGAQGIPVGHLTDYSGPTSDVGGPYGQGVADAIAYINQKGGVSGKKIEAETVDYSYQVPRALAAYNAGEGAVESFRSGKPLV